MTNHDSSTVLIVANLAARGEVVALAEGVAAQIQSTVAGCTVEMLWPDSRETTREKVASAVAGSVTADGLLRCVVAVGGDGTVRDVAYGMARGLGRWDRSTGVLEPSEGKIGGEPVLVVVPAGTGNSLYKAVWGDVSWTETIGLMKRYLAESPCGLGSGDSAESPCGLGSRDSAESPCGLGSRDSAESLCGLGSRDSAGDCESVRAVRYLDLGRVDGGENTWEPWMLGTSVGFLAETVKASIALDNLSGRQRYAVAAMEALRDLRTFSARVSVDGSVLAEGALTVAAVGGARLRGGAFAILPDSLLDDGLLDVCVIGDVNGEEMASLLARASSGERWEDPRAVFGRGRVVTVESLDGSPLCFEVDGDLWEGGECRLDMKVVPGAVPVLAPESDQVGKG